MKSYRVLLHEDGPALWPDYIDVDSLEAIRRESGTPIFNTMYQGEPGGLKGAIIRREFFRYLNDGRMEASLIAESATVAFIDPAITEKSSADETAIVVGSVHPNGMKYIRFVWHGRVGIADQERLLVGVFEHYRPQVIGVEVVAYQAALVQVMLERHPNLPIEPVTQTKDKFSRFLALGADYEFGRVLHHPSLMNSAFEHQLVHIPAAKHDDMADAAAMLAAYDNGGAVAVERPKGFV